jgi:hypothetical protein
MRHMQFFISLCVVSAFLVMLIPGVNADTQEYAFRWAVPPVSMIHAPSGIARDTNGNIYTTDTITHRVWKFRPDGSFLAKWRSSGTGNGTFSGPRGIAVTISGFTERGRSLYCSAQ